MGRKYHLDCREVARECFFFHACVPSVYMRCLAAELLLHRQILMNYVIVSYMGMVRYLCVIVSQIPRACPRDTITECTCTNSHVLTDLDITFSLAQWLRQEMQP